MPGVILPHTKYPWYKMMQDVLLIFEWRSIASLCLFLVDPTDLSNWPVTASRTGVLYRNIYCALCHGVLDVDDSVLPPGIRLDSSNLVDFWWMTVRCDKETNEEFAANFEQFTFSRLTTLLSSRLVLLLVMF